MSGIDDLMRLSADLTGAAMNVQTRAPFVVRASAASLERTAKSLCPRRTGVLERSISTDLMLGGLAAEIGPTEYYGQFVEHGTSKMPPQPFMGPAADREEPEFVAAMEALGGDVL